MKCCLFFVVFLFCIVYASKVCDCGTHFNYIGTLSNKAAFVDDYERTIRFLIYDRTTKEWSVAPLQTDPTAYTTYTIEQAQVMCYQLFQEQTDSFESVTCPGGITYYRPSLLHPSCDGFVYNDETNKAFFYTVTDGGIDSSSQRDVRITRAYDVNGAVTNQCDAPASAVFIPDVVLGGDVWQINRFRFYRDDTSYINTRASFDPYYYMFNNTRKQQSILLSSCPLHQRHSITGECCLYQTVYNTTTNSTSCDSLPANKVFTTNTSDPVNTVYRSISTQHWQTHGVFMRYSPTTYKKLKPTMWDESKYCIIPQDGCQRGTCDAGFLPCSGNGFCVKHKLIDDDGNVEVTHKCQCKQFDSGQFGQLANQTRFFGNGCQIDSYDMCYDNDEDNDAPFGLCSQNNAVGAAWCKERTVKKITLWQKCQTYSASTRFNALNDDDTTVRCDCPYETNTSLIVNGNKVPGMGAFCDINRCDPVTNCNSYDCVYDKSFPERGNIRCSCQNNYVGLTCSSETASNCIDPSYPQYGLCRGNGFCYAPGENYNSSNPDPNYSSNNAWCACRPGYIGSLCQNHVFGCPTNSSEYDTSNAYCDHATGTYTRCKYSPGYVYEYYATGAKNCSVDLCAASGGVTSRDKNGDPICNCAAAGKQLGPDGASCYPICPVTAISGSSVPQTCGDSVNNQCVLSPSVSDGQFGNATYRLHAVKTASCDCFTSSPSIASPYCYKTASFTYNTTAQPYYGTSGVGTTCESCCLNSKIVKHLDEFNAASTHCADCDAGFWNPPSSSAKDCSTRICQNGGTWNNETESCVCTDKWLEASNCTTCKLPYYGVNCTLTYCDNSMTTRIEGIPQPSTLGGHDVCQCYAPFRPIDPNSPYDCLATSPCGAHGSVPTNWNNTFKDAQACNCSAGYHTTCDGATSTNCAYCTAYQTCKNGGRPNAQNPLTCDCVFPFDIGADCSGTECDLEHSVPIAGSCNCKDHFSGIHCEVPPCKNGDWVSGRGCVCDAGFYGTYCDKVVIIPPIPSDNTVNVTNTTIVVTQCEDNSPSALITIGIPVIVGVLSIVLSAVVTYYVTECGKKGKIAYDSIKPHTGSLRRLRSIKFGK